MNKSPFYTIGAILAGIFAVVWLYVIAGMPPKSYPSTPHEDMTPSQEYANDIPLQKAATPTISHYLIKNSNGKINVYSVYSDGLTKLEKTLDTNPDTLRKIDKLKFDEGIIIKDYEALSHIIEDYVS